ncbi:hypothetical protein LUX57_21480 [Actinomadura madurae]|uniref:hypothetical protein n=1 Tax=Actinomadura madurae TaxID=1993 RepID=UPI0020D20B21|nr:hypothetical protein [Actinomadura madurae]MCP9967369.1 hypothetical protein [Actinomadura madurae]
MLGDARAVSAPLVYALITVLALHHCDTAHGTRQGHRVRLGCDGRMPSAVRTGPAGPLPFAYAAPPPTLASCPGTWGAAPHEERERRS